MDTSKSEHLLLEAINKRSSGDAHGADILFSQILNEFGNTYGVCMEAGFCKLKIGEHDKALQLFNLAYNLKNSASAAMWCGVSLRRKQQYQQAIENFERALVHDGNCHSARIEMAGCFEELKEFEKAIGNYEYLATVEQGKSLAFIYNRLGLSFEKAGMRGRLATLITSDAYYRNLTMHYSIVSTVLWSLRLNVPLRDQVIIDNTKPFLGSPEGKKIIDVLTLYMTACLGTNHPFIAEYQSLFRQTSYGKDALVLTEEYNLKRIFEFSQNCKFGTVAEGVDYVCDAIEKGMPFSLIRLGDGEGNFLGPEILQGNEFVEEMVRRILHNWFGAYDGILPQYGPLRKAILEAINGADVLGVPPFARIKDELSNDARGYWGVYFSLYLSAERFGSKICVNPVIHLDLFRNQRFLTALGKVKKIYTITCHPGFGIRLRRTLGVSGGEDFLVPGEIGIATIPESLKKGCHYPDRYQVITDAIRTFDSGSVVLVAAGACGKVYTHLAKQAGCVGIDIGAIADYLVGLRTRKIFNSDTFRNSFKFTLAECDQ